LTLFKK